jgi:hypothetical protein
VSGSNYWQSQIDPTAVDPSVPTAIRAYTADVRANFLGDRRNFIHAKAEIEELYRGWETGEFGIQDSPHDGQVFGRRDGAWTVVMTADLSVIDGGTW